MVAEVSQIQVDLEPIESATKGLKSEVGPSCKILLSQCLQTKSEGIQIRDPVVAKKRYESKHRRWR